MGATVSAQRSATAPRTTAAARQRALKRLRIVEVSPSGPSPNAPDGDCLASRVPRLQAIDLTNGFSSGRCGRLAAPAAFAARPAGFAGPFTGPLTMRARPLGPGRQLRRHRDVDRCAFTDPLQPPRRRRPRRAPAAASGTFSLGEAETPQTATGATRAADRRAGSTRCSRFRARTTRPSGGAGGPARRARPRRAGRAEGGASVGRLGPAMLRPAEGRGGRTRRPVSGDRGLDAHSGRDRAAGGGRNRQDEPRLTPRSGCIIPRFPGLFRDCLYSALVGLSGGRPISSPRERGRLAVRRAWGGPMKTKNGAAEEAGSGSRKRGTPAKVEDPGGVQGEPLGCEVGIVQTSSRSGKTGAPPQEWS